MRNEAAVLYGPHDVRLEERPVPVPGPREVLVEVRSVGVCGSDVHYYEHGRIGSFVVEQPLVLGHESMGVVVGLGSEVTKHHVGERVALEPGVPCGTCRECRAGRYNLCPYVKFFATPPVDGAFARYVTIHEDFAYALPDEISDDAGALVEPVSVGLWACRKARLRGGEHVLVTGAGPIGLLAMQAAFALGAAKVTVTDVVDERLQFARKVGATATVNVRSTPLVEAGVEADVLIECSGSPTAVADGLRCLRPAGTAVLVGMGPGETVEIPVAYLQQHEIWLTGTFRYANTYPDAIELIRAGKIRPEEIITGHYPLAEAESAMQATRRDPSQVKVMVLPQLEA